MIDMSSAVRPYSKPFLLHFMSNPDLRLQISV